MSCRVNPYYPFVIIIYTYTMSVDYHKPVNSYCWEKGMSGEIAVQIIAVFFGLFTVIVAIVLWYTRGIQRDRNVLEVKKKQIAIIDNHFNEFVRVECLYCKTLYPADRTVCPNCGAETKKIMYPKIPEQ
jgi:hypothetical protein